MKTKRIHVKNLKALEEMNVDFNGCSAIITGGNNKGKSSFLKSLPERIQGKNPDIVLKKGEEDGIAIRELTSGAKFTWQFDEDGEKLTYTTPEGIDIKKGVIKNFGKKFFGTGFDIDKFLNSTPKEQKKTLQDLVGIDLSDLEEKYNALYSQRTDVNAVQRSEKKKLEEFYLNNKETLSKEKPKKKHNLDQIQTKIQDQVAVNTNIEKVKEHIKQLEEDLRKSKERLENHEYVDLHKMKEKYEELKQENEVFETHQRHRELQETTSESVALHKKLDKEVKAVENEKMQRIKDSKLPEGFEFTEDGITFNGYPLDKKQLSSSQIYIASLKLASMALGEINTLTFDASYLDNKSLKEVEERANKNDLQLLIERPDRDGGDITYELLS